MADSEGHEVLMVEEDLRDVVTREAMQASD